MPAQTYEEVLAELKKEELLEPQEFEKLQHQVQDIISMLQKDVKRIPLKSSYKVRQLVELLFVKHDVKNISVYETEQPSQGSSLCTDIIGAKEAGAFNIAARYFQGVINVYLWPVPPGGNLR